MAIRAVLLDAGNTILGLDYPRIAAVFRRHGLDADAGAVREAEHRIRPALDAWYRASGTSTETRNAFVHYTTLVLEGLGRRGPPPPELLDELRSAGGLFGPAIPGAAEAVRRLARRGLRLAVVSNAGGTVAAELEAIGIGPFELVVDSRIVGVEKPDPRIIRIALGVLGLRPEETLFVGDLPSVDGRAARAAGTAFVLVDPAGVYGQAPSIRSIAELPEREDLLI